MPCLAPSLVFGSVSDEWIIISRRAQPRPFSPDATLIDLATSAATCVGAAYAGVDILVDRDNRPWVLEVNSMPGWKGLQRVSKASIASHIASSLLATLR